MRARTRRCLALVVSVLGIATMFGAGVVAKDRLFERWYLWKLESEDFRERFRAARKLGEMRSTRATPQLIALLKESQGHDREAREISGSRSSAGIFVAGVIGGIGPAAVPDLARALEDSRNERKYWRRCALHALRKNREEAILPLIDLVGDGYLCVRLAAIGELGSRGLEAKEAVAALTGALEDQSHNVRHAAARALKKIQGDPQ